MASYSVKLRSGDLMPLMGLGTFMSMDPKQVHDAVIKALEVGYRHIDTAYIYGNEGTIGEALEEAFQKGIVTREQLFIVTKLPSHGHSRVEHFLQLSLNKLKLSYVDLYLVHAPLGMKYTNDANPWPKNDDGKMLYQEIDHVDLWKEMEKCVDEGLTKNIGLSNFNSKQIQRVFDAARIKPANLQVECHLYMQQEKLLNFCRNLGISFTAYAPFGSPQFVPFAKAMLKRDIPDNPNVLEDPIVGELAKKYHKSPAQICLRWLIQRGLIAIPKSTNAGRIEENFKVFDFELTDDELQKLKRADRNQRFFNMSFSEDDVKEPTFPFRPEIEF